MQTRYYIIWKSTVIVCSIAFCGTRISCDNVKPQSTHQEEGFEQLIDIIEFIDLRWWTIVWSRFIIRVSRLLRLRPTADSPVPNGPSCVLKLPFKVNLLSNLSRLTRQHSESCHGKGRIKRKISLQTLKQWLWRFAHLHREAGSWGNLRVSSLSLPMSGRIMQVAGITRLGHGTPHHAS